MTRLKPVAGRGVYDRRLHQSIQGRLPIIVFLAGKSCGHRDDDMIRARIARSNGDSADKIGRIVGSARRWHRQMLRHLGILPPVSS